MGTVRSKRSSIFRLPFWNQHNSHFSWASRGCRVLVILCLLGLTYMFGFTPFVPSLHGESAIISLEEDDIIGNLVLEHASNVLSQQEEPRVVLAQRTDRPADRSFFLAAVIFNRVFKEDLFKITAYECKQWIEYMVFSGVEHIFWYDTAHSDQESQEAYLTDYVNRGILTYHRFHHMFPGNVESGYHFEQDHSYEHFLSTHSSKVKWVVEMDVDEYPFMPTELNSMFLKEYVLNLESSRPDVSQVLLPCMIFGGNPEGDLDNGWVIERYQRRKRLTEGSRPGFVSRTKPIFQPKLAKGVSSFDPHQFPMKEGETMVTRPEVLRMNHYWGPRLTDFKPDTPAVIALLVPDDSIQPIATLLKSRSGLTSKATALSI
ncbi:hypothetical protein MPTK1_2g21390 [Marchantia polymorpha subsp. ruderalis]|nr:hypothetical protein MARPO_0040s0075 [Marchantia polymorpha]BBN03175.1 hypothetical protein Mp_2g21390 [Marchantia polymorpha subsp. ruderalis]|eukprot:PTQ40402.1 hypothetical protein MARPO_0040s0075 [Marchantia polymorpha]